MRVGFWQKLLGKTRTSIRFRATPLTTKPRLEILEDRNLLSVNVLSSFNGLSYDPSQGGENIPPDPCGAAGTTNYVETVNSHIAIYGSKDSSNPTSISDTLTHFFSSVGAGTGLTDPIVLWDDCADPMHTGQLVNRFFVGVLDEAGSSYKFDLAVSNSASPTDLTTSSWYFYQFNVVAGADYPGNLGFNSNALVITLNDNSGGVQITSIKIADLISGTQLSTSGGTQNIFQNPFPYAGNNVRPTVMHDSVDGDPMWLLQSALSTCVLLL